MADIPTPLYRAVEEEKAVDNHYEGLLWFKSYRALRETEGPGQDKLEGIGSNKSGNVECIDVTDDRPTISLFVLCFSEIYLEDYGNFELKLENPCALRDEVASQFCKETEVQWRKISYNKAYCTPSPPLCGEYMERKFYSKPPRFAGEKEWRLVICLPAPLRLWNEKLELKVSGDHGLFKAQDRACLPRRSEHDVHERVVQSFDT